MDGAWDDDDACSAPGSDDYLGGCRRADGAGRAVSRQNRCAGGALAREMRLLLLVDGAGQPPPPGRNNARLCYMTLL